MNSEDVSRDPISSDVTVSMAAASPLASPLAPPLLSIHPASNAALSSQRSARRAKAAQVSQRSSRSTPRDESATAFISSISAHNPNSQRGSSQRGASRRGGSSSSRVSGARRKRKPAAPPPLKEEETSEAKVEAGEAIGEAAQHGEYSEEVKGLFAEIMGLFAPAVHAPAKPVEMPESDPWVLDPDGSGMVRPPPPRVHHRLLLSSSPLRPPLLLLSCSSHLPRPPRVRDLLLFSSSHLPPPLPLLCKLLTRVLPTCRLQVRRSALLAYRRKPTALPPPAGLLAAAGQGDPVQLASKMRAREVAAAGPPAAAAGQVASARPTSETQALSREEVKGQHSRRTLDGAAASVGVSSAAAGSASAGSTVDSSADGIDGSAV